MTDRSVREHGPDAPRLHCASLLGVTAALAAAFHFRAFRFRHALITIMSLRKAFEHVPSFRPHRPL